MDNKKVMLGGRGGHDVPAFKKGLIQTLARKVIEQAVTGSLLIIYIDDALGILSKQAAVHALSEHGWKEEILTAGWHEEDIRTATIESLIEYGKEYANVWILAKARDLNTWKEELSIRLGKDEVPQVIKNDEILCFIPIL